MKQSETVKEILSRLERVHPNLYHSVEKNVVLDFIDKVDWNNLDELQFDKNMLKFFALFKDAHTSYCNIKYKFIERPFFYNLGKIYKKEDGVIYEIKSINGFSTEEVIDRFDKLINYEVVERRNAQLDREVLWNGYYFQLAEITSCEGFDYTYIDQSGNEIKKRNNFISQEEFFRRNPPKRSQSNYEYKIINGNVLYLIYRRCSNQEGYSFQQFIEDMKHDINLDNIEGYILDLRGNNGGDSRVLLPFEDFVIDNGLQGVVLTDNKTFSSAVLATASFKKLGAILVGENPAMRTYHYGDSPRHNINGVVFSCCTKCFDDSLKFGYRGPIKTDVYVEKTIKDYRNNTDSQLDKAIDVVSQIISEREGFDE